MNPEKSAHINAMKDLLKEQGLEPAALLQQNLDKLLPRLKGGHVESAKNVKVSLEVEGQPQEFEIPASSYMVGMDLNPDFSCCFVLDMDNSYQFITRGQLEETGMSKQELLEVSCTNFMQRYAPSIQLVDMNFEGVKKIRIDGNTEACTFLFNDVWQSIMQQLGFKTLFLMVPLQDVVLVWEKLEEEALEQLIERIQRVVANNAASKRISNYIFEYHGSGFTPIRQVFV
ncbi:MAG: hypothetical protein IPL65_04410 [Lewinellaceae bacterium]|nr:hypothetical protein [Lewinellaceae bacterium]